MLPQPRYFAKAQPGRPPVMPHWSPRAVVAKPRNKIVYLVAFRQDGRKANNLPLAGVWTLQEALNLHFVAHLTLAEPDHVSFIKNYKANIIDERRVVAQREIQFFRRGYDDVARAQNIF